MTLKWNLMRRHQRNEAVADQKVQKRRPQPNLNQPKKRPVSYLSTIVLTKTIIVFVLGGSRRGRPKKKEEEEPKSSEEDGEANDDEDAEEGDDE